MRKKRIMIVGPEKSGKTTLASLLEGEEVKVKRIPSMVYRKNTLDTPGAYLESPWMKSHLIAAAQDASCVVMVSDAAGKKRAYPPGFAKVFRVPIIGVVTRCDLPGAEIRSAEKQLIEAGVPHPIYFVSINDTEKMELFLQAVSRWKPEKNDPIAK